MTYLHNETITQTDLSMRYQVLNGMLATVIVVTGEKLMLNIAKQPLLVFGLGMVGGVIVYKNRKAIIDGTTKTMKSGKYLLLEQKEKVLDLVAEVIEDKDSVKN